MDREALNALISQNLQDLMDEKGLTASAWAKSAGLSHTGVRDILQGKVKNPTYLTLVSLAEVAGVDVKRITVGPDVDDPASELIDLLLQLEPGEREFLLNAAKAQLASRDLSHHESGEEN